MTAMRTRQVWIHRKGGSNEPDKPTPDKGLESENGWVSENIKPGAEATGFDIQKHNVLKIVTVSCIT